MRACVYEGAGDASVLSIRTVHEPTLKPGQVLIDVAAAGVNRADIGQRQGSYPPPPGASPLPGLEVSGVVVEVATEAHADAAAGAHTNAHRTTSGIRVGDRVCALLAGGGYAERVAVDARHVLPVPDAVDLVDAAGLPEAVATVWYNVFQRGRLAPGEVLLVHGGSSGIGTMAIQLATARGSRVAVTAGSAAKLEACAELGARILIDYRSQDFVAELLAATDGAGADVVLDAIAGPYVERDIRALAREGRIVLIGNQSGGEASLPVGLLMAKRGEIHGTTLRAQPADAKAAILQSVLAEVWPLVASGAVRPVIDSRFALEAAADAQRRMEGSEHVGKILLTM
jgi:putative PIG3 family NAD(P)H quinone oxidoreductase